MSQVQARQVGVRHGKRLRHVALGALLVVLLTACGVPIQGQPEAQPPLPRIATSAASPTETETEPVARGTVTLFFIAEGGVIATSRAGIELSPAGVLQALLRGPTVAEQRLGLASLLNPGDVADIAMTDDGAVVVSLSARFDQLSVTEQRRAIAQTVLSLDASGIARSVFFERGGVPAVLPDAAGNPLSGRVTRDDVKDLIRDPAENSGETSTS
jgi:hypothetical protein